MYVCICNAVTEKHIQQAVAAGHVRTPDDLEKHLNISSCCGSCDETARECLERQLRGYLDSPQKAA